MDYDKMPAGREMDALIQKTFYGEYPKDLCPICGWKFAKSREDGCVPGDCSMRPPPAVRADTPLNYSEDIALAWCVLCSRKLLSLGYVYIDIWYDSVIWGCTLRGTDGRQIIGQSDLADPSATLAICRALLRVADVEASAPKV